MIRKPVIVLAALAAVISGAAAGSGKSRIESTSAYFSDRESHTNIYTFGEVSADGTETEWNPEQGTHLLPGESMPKNPQIINTGANAAVVFIALDSPVLSRVRIAQSDGSYQEASNIEAWHYLQNDGTEGFHENWILLETDSRRDPADLWILRRTAGEERRQNSRDSSAVYINSGRELRGRFHAHAAAGNRRAFPCGTGRKSCAG